MFSRKKEAWRVEEKHNGDILTAEATVWHEIGASDEVDAHALRAIYFTQCHDLCRGIQSSRRTSCKAPTFTS